MTTSSDRRNVHGLSRDIPTAVKRSVLASSDYGCAECGDILGEFHHFDPPFKDCKDHDADGIIYLCRTHHGLAELGLISKETIKYLKKAPFSRRKNHVRFEIPTMVDFDSFSLGTNRFFECDCVFKIRDESYFTIYFDEAECFVPQLSCSLLSRSGKPALEINANEIVFMTPQIRIERQKNVYRFFDEDYEFLSFRIDEYGIEFIEFHLGVGFVNFQLVGDELRVQNGFSLISVSNCSFYGIKEPIYIDDKEFSYKISGFNVKMSRNIKVDGQIEFGNNFRSYGNPCNPSDEKCRNSIISYRRALRSLSREILSIHG